MTRSTRLWLCALLLLGATLSWPAAAETYQVDVLVFAQGGTDGEAPLPLQMPDVQRAIDPADADRLRSGGVHTLPDNAAGLGNLWAGLVRGHHYERLARLSWVQSDPPENRGPALRISAGDSVQTAAGAVRALDGAVALHGGFYLHVDTDLVWTTSNPDGSPATWRIHENRRLRLNETHYLDGARLGMITRVTKLTR